ncbi:hypothetical protein DFP92_1047 [Yoonia sediminilitoris]|uniref:Uncharacterized protein n=2 Tax=Yoonia sediminilitoris TaxID=1286148 RepID=A0A2T6KI50_9RHOB|nr:hypothetical protein C8N45_1047 [Yoonia sediminilitoris]RCW95997.1 hypothetical protein DFP92_1047 [Yoonia sediminilitoris]
MLFGASPLWTVFAFHVNTGPMTERQAHKNKNTAKTREERLKAALKANMGKRKAQARARATDNDKTVPNKNEKE